MLKIKNVDEAKIHSSQLEDWRQMKVVHSGAPCLLLTFAQANLQIYSLTLVLITPWYIISNLGIQLSWYTNMVYHTLSWYTVIIINPQLGNLVYHLYGIYLTNLLIQGTLQPDFAFSSFNVDSSTAPAPDSSTNAADCWAKKSPTGPIEPTPY